MEISGFRVQWAVDSGPLALMWRAGVRAGHREPWAVGPDVEGWRPRRPPWAEGRGLSSIREVSL